MRLFKKFLLFATELIFLFFGLLFVAGFVTYLDSDGIRFAALYCAFGFFFVGAVLVWFRRKTGKWTINADAAAWIEHRSWCQLHPRRAKNFRILKYSLLWFPSACAAIVLFFLPFASHIGQLGSPLVPHYRISLPINWMVVYKSDMSWFFFTDKGPARYGLTPVWFNRAWPSATIFRSIDPNLEGWPSPDEAIQKRHATDVAKSSLRLGTIEADCWEYAVPVHYAGGVRWQVDCRTRPNGRDFNLYANFVGHKEDIPSFYRVLQGTSPTD